MMGSVVERPDTAGPGEVETVDLSRLVPIFKRYDPLLFPGFGDRFGWHWHYQDYARYGIEAKVGTMIEVGVRHGNCAAAVMTGAWSAYWPYLGRSVPEDEKDPPRQRYLGLDVEQYERGSNAVARALLAEACPWLDFDVVSWNTQGGSLPFAATACRWDLAHVDGDHSRDGAVNDMVLLWPLVRPGGLMVVDDVCLHKDVMGAVREFSVVSGAPFRVVENQTGQAVFTKPPVSK